MAKAKKEKEEIENVNHLIMPTFVKYHPTLNIKTWLSNFELKCDSYNLDAQWRILHISDYLQDEALIYHYEILSNIGNWPEAKEKLINRFQKIELMPLVEAIKVYQGEQETISDYYHRKMKMINLVKLPSKSIVELLNEGILKKYKPYLATIDTGRPLNWLTMVNKIENSLTGSGTPVEKCHLQTSNPALHPSPRPAGYYEGREDVNDEGRAGRPSTSTTDEKINEVEKLILANRRITVREVAEDLNISIGSCHSIFIYDLGMRRVAAKFVPKLLNCDQKQHRMNIANEMVDSVRDDPNLLQRVITGDEAWVYGYNVETKAQSSQWKLPHEPRPKKARQVRSNVEVLLTLFFDCRGVVHNEFLPQGRTVNKEYYLQGIPPYDTTTDLNLQTYPPIEESRKLAIQRTQKSHENSRIIYDKTHLIPDFKIGDQSRQDCGRQGTSKQIDHCLYRKMEQGREEDPKEPMESDPDYESGENTTFPKLENTLGRTGEVTPSHEGATPPPAVSDVLGSLTRTLHQLSAVTGLSRDVGLPRYNGSY
ncbi:hypothetical protein LAZ67_5002380 [Cordylochernes scorpioides]|uniref:Uncharacterized protein n=1 Tax=Cordylochernes scorpioides TaxID=51811 RepID=A0ABY6KHF0_9ARAC|nr:hypothetical protein LAZ67_5002380 [Cordylochernes scorpioides]